MEMSGLWSWVLWSGYGAQLQRFSFSFVFVPDIGFKDLCIDIGFFVWFLIVPTA